MKNRSIKLVAVLAFLLTAIIPSRGATLVGLLVDTNDALANVTAQRLWSSNFLAIASNQIASSISSVTLGSLGAQPTNANLTTLSSLTGGSSTNFLSGDGSFKQVTTNMIPGLVADIAGREPLNSNKYQRTNSMLTVLQGLPYAAGDLIVGSIFGPTSLLHPGSNGKVPMSTNTPAGGIVWMDPPSSAGSGTVTSVGATSTVSGLQFSGVPITSSGTASLTGIVGVASGGTAATTAAGARTNLGVVIGVDVQAYDSDLADLSSASSTGTGPFVRATNASMAIGTLTVTTNATLTNATLNGTTTLASSTNTGTMGVAGALTVGSTNIALAIAGKANSATTLSGYGITDAEPLNSNKYQATNANLTTLASSGFTGSSGAIVRSTAGTVTNLTADGTTTLSTATNTVSVGAPLSIVGSTNIALELSKKANTNAPTFIGTSTFAGITNVGTIGSTGAIIAGSTNIAEALALKAPLTSAALVTPTLTNATLTGTLTAGGGVGSAGQILSSTGTGVAWSNAPAGGGFTGTSLMSWHAADALPGTNSSTAALYDVRGDGIPAIVFTNAANTEINFEGWVPSGFTLTGGVSLTVAAYQEGNGGSSNVVFRAQIMNLCCTGSGALDTNSFLTAYNVTSTLPTTASVATNLTISMSSITNLTAGGMIRVNLTRMTDSASDTNNFNAGVIGARLNSM